MSLSAPAPAADASIDAKSLSATSLKVALAPWDLGRFAFVQSPFGARALLLGDTEEELRAQLAALFPRLSLQRCAAAPHAPAVARFLNDPSLPFPLPLDLSGTPFQQRVWRQLQSIGLGQTASYSEVASALKIEGGARAVAGACAANVLAVVIPCHRVVRAQGAPSGYRWGLSLQQRILQHERALADIAAR